MIGQGRNMPDRRQQTVPFQAINRPRFPGYVEGLQRHHLIPRALPEQRCFVSLFATLGAQAGLDDFRSNGMLLPACEAAAARMRLPLHRGPHRAYSHMVAERLGEIESGWSRNHDGIGTANAVTELQRALRRELLSPRRTFHLNARDPLGRGVDFSRIDALADELWGATQPRYGAVFSESAAIAA
jgi:hypothetical protein